MKQKKSLKNLHNSTYGFGSALEKHNSFIRFITYPGTTDLLRYARSRFEERSERETFDAGVLMERFGQARVKCFYGVCMVFVCLTREQLMCLQYMFELFHWCFICFLCIWMIDCLIVLSFFFQPELPRLLEGFPGNWGSFIGQTFVQLFTIFGDDVQPNLLKALCWVIRSSRWFDPHPWCSGRWHSPSPHRYETTTHAWHLGSSDILQRSWRPVFAATEDEIPAQSSMDCKQHQTIKEHQFLRCWSSCSWEVKKLSCCYRPCIDIHQGQAADAGRLSLCHDVFPTDWPLRILQNHHQQATACGFLLTLQR